MTVQLVFVVLDNRASVVKHDESLISFFLVLDFNQVLSDNRYA